MKSFNDGVASPFKTIKTRLQEHLVTLEVSNVIFWCCNNGNVKVSCLKLLLVSWRETYWVLKCLQLFVIKLYTSKFCEKRCKCSLNVSFESGTIPKYLNCSTTSSLSPLTKTDGSWPSAGCLEKNIIHFLCVCVCWDVDRSFKASVLPVPWRWYFRHADSIATDSCFVFACT